MRLTDERITEIEERCEKATEGKLDVFDDSHAGQLTIFDDTFIARHIAYIPISGVETEERARANADFFIAARQDLPDAVADLKEERAGKEALEAYAQDYLAEAESMKLLARRLAEGLDSLVSLIDEGHLVERESTHMGPLLADRARICLAEAKRAGLLEGGGADG